MNDNISFNRARIIKGFNAIFKERIYKAFPLEKQNNLNREALEFLLSTANLTVSENKRLEDCQHMNREINRMRQECKKLKKKLRELPADILQTLDGNYKKATIIEDLEFSYLLSKKRKI